MGTWDVDRDELAGLASVRGGEWLRRCDGQLGLLDLTADAVEGRRSLERRGILDLADDAWRVRDGDLGAGLEVLAACRSSVAIVVGRSLRVSHQVASSSESSLMVETTADDASSFRITTCSHRSAATRLMELLDLEAWEGTWAPGPWRHIVVRLQSQQVQRLDEARSQDDADGLGTLLGEALDQPDVCSALASDMLAGLEAVEVTFVDYAEVERSAELRFNRSPLGGFWRFEPDLVAGALAIYGSDGADIGSRAQDIFDRMAS